VGNSKQYLENNKEKIREQRKQYRENNKESIKQYRQDNKEKTREQRKQYRENNKESIKQYYQDNKESIKQYYQDNKESIKQYYQDNKEQIRERSKQYRENNKERLKQYRENNEEQIREQRKQYRENNKESIKQYRENNKEQLREKKKQYRENNKEAWNDIINPCYFTRRLSAIKCRAKSRNIDFDLDAEYLKAIWPEDGKCPALGLTMTSLSERDCFPSIDRNDNTKGYVKGNVHWVSLKANRIMNNGTPEEVMKVALFFQRATEERANAG